MDEIKEKAKELAVKLGIKIEEWTDDQYQKLVEAKEELDKETRRKTRAFWAPVGFAIGSVVGYVCAAIF